MTRRFAFLVMGAGLIVVNPSLGQKLSPYPEWAIAGRPFDPANFANPPGSSAAWAEVSPWMLAGSKWGNCFLPIGPWVFSSHSSSGTIAVESRSHPPLGINTGFSDILFIGAGEATPTAKFAAYDRLLIWSGKLPDGRWGMGYLPLDFDQPLDESLVRTITPRPLPGEVWYTCGVVDGRLYILDTAGPKFIRFISSETGTFDVRDSGFEVPILGPESNRPQIFAIHAPILMDARYILGFETGFHARYERHFVVQSAGGFSFVAELHPDEDARRVDLLHQVCAGMSTVGIRGPVGHAVFVETAPSPTGPWVVASAILTTTDSRRVLPLPLKRPLRQNSYVRMIDLTACTEGPVRSVGPTEPTLFAVQPLRFGYAVPGSTIEILGGGWGSAPEVTLEKLAENRTDPHDPTPIPLSGLTVTPDFIRVPLPDESLGSVRLRISSANGSITRQFRSLHIDLPK